MDNDMIKLPPKDPAGINGKMRVGHVALRTMDYDGTIQWYKEKLGFRLLIEWTVRDLKLAYLAPANDDRFWLEVIAGGITGAHQDPALPIISGITI
jgi:lactoylglutathione lyase